MQRVNKLWTKLERTGVRPERCSSSGSALPEGQKFSAVMKRMEELSKTVTMEEIEHAKEALQRRCCTALG